MAHERKRHLEAAMLHLAKLSPLVGLLGHRQVGKTTLLEAVSDRYLSFDDEAQLTQAESDPVRFLAGLKRPGTAIDECQLCERIFPALKERVRKHKRPGQFFLSGSVRFTSKKLIRESLTGRIMNLELLPLTLSELDRGELPDWVQRLLVGRRMADTVSAPLPVREFDRRMGLIRRYDECGGLPGACFIRNAKLRAQKLMDQLETILDRDLRQIHETTLALPELLRFLRELALHDGRAVQHQALRRVTGISPITQKKLLFALEATFILRHIPIEGDYSGSVIFFEDHAEAAMLSQGRLSAERRWEGLVIRNLREQIFYRTGENAEMFQYRTRAGVLVPFALRTPEAVLGVLPVKGLPRRLDLAAAQSFLRKYGAGRVALVTDANESRAIDDRTLLIPAASILFPA